MTPAAPAARPSPGLRVIIGYAESVDLPAWGIEGLRTKVDTGARSSALHVSDLRMGRAGRTVRFRVVLTRKGKRHGVEIEAPVVRRTQVRSSSGHTEERVVVRTQVRVGPLTKEVEITLTERAAMRYRMLLGRTALAPEFLVDSSHRYTAGKPKRTERPRKRKTSTKRSPAP